MEYLTIEDLPVLVAALGVGPVWTSDCWIQLPTVLPLASPAA